MSSSLKASIGVMDKEKSAGASGGGGGGGASAAGERAGTASSKAYSSHLAVQTDATKYRGKYKELKKKVRQIELENDKLHFKTLRIKRNIQRMRLERAILYERLEAEISQNAALEEGASLTIQERSYGTPNERENQLHGGSVSQHSHSTPSNRRVIDYSPSPEEAKPISHPIAGNGEARQNMKVTLKRNNHANGKEPSWQ